MLNNPTPAAAAPSFAAAQPPPGYGSPMGGFANTQRPASTASTPANFASPMAPTMQPMQSQSLFGGAPAMQPMASQASYGSAGRPASTPAAPAPAPKPAGNFDDLWSLGLGAASSKPATPVAGQKSIQALQKEKAQASIWGGANQQGKQPQPAQFGAAFGVSSTSNAGNSGGDDLLL